ncbi:hypothetical protein Golob_025398, partial [Gossypium lobatum]|nr:hypothetical protein [Gossypium lobatum]
MFQFAKLSLICPWIQQQFERLTYSRISGSMLTMPSRVSRCLALFRLNSRDGDKQTRTADIRHK